MSNIIYPFPTEQEDILKDNIEEYNNYITQKNYIKEQYKNAKDLIQKSKKNSINLLDLWEGEAKKFNKGDSYENIYKIIYYDLNDHNGIHFDQEVAKYFIDNFRINNLENKKSFLYQLYPSDKSKNNYHLVIITYHNIYFTNNNPESKNYFNIVSF